MLKNKDFLVLLIRLFLGYVFFSAGVCKLTGGHFGQLIGPPWLIEALAKYQLGFFAQVVAGCQVICGALLFSQRFSTLGAVMLVPMNLSILAVTISQNWAGTPYVNAVFLLLNLLLLAYEYQRFLFLISVDPSKPVMPSPLEELRKGYLPWTVLGIALATMAAAPWNLLLTNILGLGTFALTALCVVKPKLLSNLEKAIVALAAVNMCVLTLGMKLPFAQALVGGGSVLIFLLLLINFWRNGRKTTRAPQLASPVG